MNSLARQSSGKSSCGRRNGIDIARMKQAALNATSASWANVLFLSAKKSRWYAESFLPTNGVVSSTPPVSMLDFDITAYTACCSLFEERQAEVVGTPKVFYLPTV